MEQFGEVHERLKQFSDERDWGQFHTPRNLAMALAGEVGEVLSLLQWVPSSEVADWLSLPRNADDVRHELADVFAYLLHLADSCDVDLVAALAEKLEINRSKYPVESARGSAKKYTELEQRELPTE